MKFKNKYKELLDAFNGLQKELDELKEEKKYWINEINDLETFYIRKYPGPYLEFEVHLAEHCNLNCKGCDHFSPIAEPKFADINVFERDFKRMSELFGDSVKSINLLGGEPLLNPRITEYIAIARECFRNVQKTEIRVVTNGILLKTMPEYFWHQCQKYSIKVCITKYPIGLKYDELFDIGTKNNVTVEFYDPTDGEKELYRVPLKLEGNMDPKRNYYKCPSANVCCFLKNGRLYTCTLVPNIEHFNKYFGTNLPVSEEDSIDIYSAKSKEEIFYFLSKPINFCRFCDTESKEYGIKWTQSCKDIKEWLN